MDRLDAMAVFVAVADQRSFAAAARRLRRTPSAVTRLVAALEDRLGARLLRRTTRSVSLTDVGARYLARARRILADVAEADAAAQAERAAPSGHFVVAAPLLFGRLHVAPLLGDYLRAYPAVTAELTLSDRNANLVDDGVDAAVRIGVLDDSSLVARAVGATRRVLVGAPAYLAAHRAPRTLGDLARHRLIQVTGVSPLPEWRFVRDGADVRVPIAPAFVTNSADVAIDHALRGGGLTLVLAYQVIDALRADRLRVLLPRVEPPPLPIHIVYPASRLLSAKVRTFIDLAATSTSWRFLAL
ncbi:MAG TPA: LysR family transcriptional regulator [Kofleriaceae bacterium]|nr:LysR family transcriptional regulator [Kofleriaceae bacterium]